ncbi:MAG TPA: DNRLRE domain-containing protein [Thermoanaerobaculia bacterium]|nr:DNRLRE domain-containing protein [Thermoanaerobaculia bacterium]
MRLMMVTVLVTLLMIPSLSAAATVDFAGITWDVRSGSGSPGNGCWDDSPGSVWVDGQGRLHLKIRQVNGIWCQAQVTARTFARYGRHDFYVDSGLENLDPHAVFAMYLYKDDDHELDIEITKSFDWSSPNNTWHVVQKICPGSVNRSFNVPWSGTSTHSIEWLATSVRFDSYEGYCAQPPCSGPLNHHDPALYSGPFNPAESLNLRTNISLWINGTVNGEQEVVISDYRGSQDPMGVSTDLFATHDAGLRGGGFSSRNYGGQVGGSAEQVYFGMGNTDELFLDPGAAPVRGALQFDLSSIPSAAAIQNATLELGYAIGYGSQQSPAIEIAPFISGWGESTITWANRPATDASHKVDETFPACGFNPLKLNVTDLVAAWVHRVIPNHGAQLSMPSLEGLPGNAKAFLQCEWDASGTKCPKLTVTYLVEPSTPPAAPTWLRTTAASASQIDLQWDDNANNESGFKIERKQGCCGPWTQVAIVGADLETWSDSGLQCGTTYAYRVLAYNSAGNSGKTNEAAATTSSCPPPLIPACPTWLRVTPFANRIDLEWDDNSTNEDGFKVERKQGCCGSWTLVSTLGPNVETWSNTSLACGTTYAYRVWAFNATGSSCKTNEAGTTISPCP